MTYAFSSESLPLEPGVYYGFWHGWVVTIRYFVLTWHEYTFVATLGIRGRVACVVTVSPGGGAKVETQGFDFSPS